MTNKDEQLELFYAADYEKQVAEPRSADALTGFATGRKLQREQTILTPESVLAFCRTLWHAPVALDPCSSGLDQELVHADVRYLESDDGLSKPWTDRTYVNPPYKHLKQWMAKASLEAEKGYRIVTLCPVRGHREWWHEYRDTAAVEVQLKPLKFVGYAGAFPAPLCLLIWNEEIEVAPFLESSGLKYTRITYF